MALDMFRSRFFGATYFKPEYLHGSSDAAVRSGVNRLIAMMMQEAADKSPRRKAQTPPEPVVARAKRPQKRVEPVAEDKPPSRPKPTAAPPVEPEIAPALVPCAVLELFLMQSIHVIIDLGAAQRAANDEEEALVLLLAA